MSVDHALEYPQSPPRLDIPLWSENYIFQGSCPDQGIFFYQNIGRVANNPTWWRSMFNLVLPDGNIVTARTYGRGKDEEGPRTVSYTARCVAPMSQWRLQYDGFASVTTQEQNATRYLSPVVPPESFEFDALWHGDTPVWDLAHGLDESQPWSDMHYEQAGTVRGVVRLRGETITFDGFGYRDHSTGARDLSTGTSHTWVQAHFPESRRHVGAIMMNFESGRLAEGYVTERDTLHGVKVLDIPEWPAGEQWWEHREFTLDVEAPGGPLTVTGRPLGPSFYYTLAAPSELIPGYDPTDPSYPNPWALRENMCAFDLGGEPGIGFLEISRRHA